MNNIYTGLGKRKTSIAKVFLKEGSGIITVNSKIFEEFFVSLGEQQQQIKNTLNLLSLHNKLDINIIVHGGGINSQFEAAHLAIAKAICTIDSKYRVILKQESLLTRDSRIKERRKYGLKKARKASQYSKR